MTHFQDYFDLRSSIVILVSMLDVGQALECEINQPGDCKWYMQVFHEINVEFPCKIKLDLDRSTFCYVRVPTKQTRIDRGTLLYHRAGLKSLHDK